MEPGAETFCGILARSHDPSVIYDIGARDCYESSFLIERFTRSTAFAFEPNPDTIGLCYATAAQHKGRLTVFNTAVSNSSGNKTFFKSNTRNTGYSSLYKPSGDYDHVEPMPFDECVVRSVRLDDMIRCGICEPPDTLWMDCQGGELNALYGLGDYIDGVVAVWVELLYGSIYDDCPSSSDVEGFLEDSGMRKVYEEKCGKDSVGKLWFGNACFLRK